MEIEFFISTASRSILKAIAKSMLLPQPDRDMDFLTKKIAFSYPEANHVLGPQASSRLPGLPGYSELPRLPKLPERS